LRSYLNKK